MPAVAEIGGIPENRPRSLSALRRDKELARLPRFATIDFSLLEAEEEWPPPRDRSSRSESRQAAVRRFLLWLRGRPERRVVLVSHHNFLQGLLATTSRIENCTPIVCEVSPDGRATASELQRAAPARPAKASREFAPAPEPLSAEEQRAWAALEAEKAALPPPPRGKGKPSAEQQRQDAPRQEALRRFREARRAFIEGLSAGKRRAHLERYRSQRGAGQSRKKNRKKK